MIFISGIHGVGKTHFCNIIKKELGFEAYSSSQLISQEKGKIFLNNKLTSDIEDNQYCLCKAVDELKNSVNTFLLDGHFCLLNEKGIITRIPMETFENIRPSLLILLTEEPEIIANRRFQRDGIMISIDEIASFQNEEKNYAKTISDHLEIPLLISSGSDDYNRILDSIKKGLK